MSSPEPVASRRAQRAPFILPWYQFAELQRFAVAERERVVDDACEDANVRFSVLAGWGLTLAVLAACAYVLGARLAEHNPLLVLAAAVLLFVPLFLHRRAVIHQLVRDRAAALDGSGSSR